MATRALLLAVALCAVQCSQASLLVNFDITGAVGNFSSILSAMQNIQDEIQANIASIESKVEQEIASLEANVSSSISEISSEIAENVQKAIEEGFDASTCGVNAFANLTTINLNLPISLGLCYITYLDAFEYYQVNIENDISAAKQAVDEAVSAFSNCKLINFYCNWNIYTNTTSFINKKMEDVLFQYVNSATAGVNLLATINKCLEETSAQAVLDAYHVLDNTEDCIEAV